MVEALELKLHSPAGTDPDVYQWPLTSGRGAGKIDGAIEIVETIRWVCQEFPEVKIDNDVLSNYDTNSFESMKSLLDHYNNAVDAYLQRGKRPTCSDERLITTQRRSSRNLLRYILQQVYNHAVTNPGKLNQYEPFSPEVYGETSFELVCQIIDRVNVSEEDTFIDLGSGVGQIVLQVAASTPCKMVWGIERSEWPNRYADKMDFHFKRLMRWWGKHYGEYQLIKGDFLDQRHSEKLTSATVIFVNNFAFGPKLDHQLKERFAELRDGARIISSKEFCPLNFKISERTISDIGTIMQVSQLRPLQGSVSWTGKSVMYYVHTIDRKKLELYFNEPTENAGTTGSSRTKKDVNRVFQSDSSSNTVIPQPSGLVGSRARRGRPRKGTTNPDKIGTVACLNSTNRPVGRVGKRRENEALKKNSIPGLFKDKTTVQQLLSSDISQVTVSLQRLNLPTQPVAVVDTTKVPSSVEVYMDTIRNDFVAAISLFKDVEYRKYLLNEIELERERNSKLRLQAAELDKDILLLMQIEKTHRQQQEVTYRSRKLSRVNADTAEISVINQECVLKEIKSSVALFKRKKCKINKLSPEEIMSNRTTTVFRPSAFTGLRIHTIYSSPVQPQNGCTPCVKASSRTPESASPLNLPNGYGILPVPQVLLGYDLEDHLKNLIISALNGNANPAANIRIRDGTSPSKKENNRSNMIHCIQPLI